VYKTSSGALAGIPNMRHDVVLKEEHSLPHIVPEACCVVIGESVKSSSDGIVRRCNNAKQAIYFDDPVDPEASIDDTASAASWVRRALRSMPLAPPPRV
jgi:hypothetical protein